MERVNVLRPELQDNEIIEQRNVSPESVNVPEQPQPRSDINVVLREMKAKLDKHEEMFMHLLPLNQEQNAKLAKNEDRIEKLQTLNQEQAAKLKEVDTQQQEQAAKLKEVDTQQQEQAAKLKEVDTQQQAQAKDVDTLRQQQTAQASELKSLKTRTDVTENQLESLKRDRAVGQVAFFASLLASGSGTLGPFNTDTTLVFKRVVSNIGNAYSPNTGCFTAPVRGAYHFEFYIGAHGGSQAAGVWLVKNQEHICMASEHQTNGYGTSANGATLLLEAGDVMFLRLWQQRVIYDNENHNSTFSGHLLFLM